MRALVVYESMWGNTEQVARAIASGLGGWFDVTIHEIGAAPEDPDQVELVVAGGPTHAFSMTRPRTRADAVRSGAPKRDPEGIGLREWLDRLPRGRHRPRLATFDTRVDTVRHLPGSAAKGAARAGRRHGYELRAPAESFYVHDVAGPLLAGELERAEAWGRHLAASWAPV